MTEPFSAVIDITPVLAKELIAKNTSNRKLRQARIDHVARIITSGQWITNNDAVVISWDNVLLNGQHRLHAVVKTGVTIKSIILTGADPRAYTTMDNGAKRTMSDLTRMSASLSTDAGLLFFMTHPSKWVPTPEDVMDVATWWRPASEALHNAAAGKLRIGLENTAMRIGLGVRWATSPTEARRQHVLSQYHHMLHANMRDLDQSYVVLRERMMNGSVKMVSREDRVAAAALVFHFSDPVRASKSPLIRDTKEAVQQLVAIVTTMETAWAAGPTTGHPYVWDKVPTVTKAVYGAAKARVEAAKQGGAQ